MNNIIITGGAGFIGSNLAKKLNENGCQNIYIVDNMNHSQKEANLSRIKLKEYFDKNDFIEIIKSKNIGHIDAVFHLGACSSTLQTDEDYLVKNNYQYSVSLCEWALRKDIRFIYASTAATYGNGTRGYHDDEKEIHLLEPLNAYGRSKQKFDMWAIYNRVIDKIAGLKYFNVYGPYECHKGEMRSMVNKAYGEIFKTGKLKLFKSHNSNFNDGEQKRDFVYVDDAVAVTLFFYDNPDINGIYNCGTGSARSWFELGKAVFSAIGIEPEFEFIDMPQSIRDNYQYFTQADMNKLYSAGYSQQFKTIEEGVKSYVEEYLSKIHNNQFTGKE